MGKILPEGVGEVQARFFFNFVIVVVVVVVDVIYARMVM